jgi:acetyl esterase
VALDPDAQALADALDQLMPAPMHQLGVAGARAFLDELGRQAPAPPPVHAVTDREIPGPAGPIPVRVYRPSDEPDLPVLLYLHGGGWTIGTLDGVEALCRELCTRAGCLVVSVDYRLAPEHPFPAAIEDAYAAARWVAEHGSELGGDGTRLAIGGDSAGGNLAAAVSLLARDAGGPAIALQLLAYPATEYALERPSWLEHAKAPLLTTDDVVWFWGQYLPDASDRADPRATPNSAASLAGLPPTFVLTAEYDPIRDDGEAYAARLTQDGVDVTHVRYPGVFHGFFTMVGMLARTDVAIQDAATQLSAHLAR